jgi:hypothetical protein
MGTNVQMQRFHAICAEVRHFQESKYDFASKDEVVQIFRDFEHASEEDLYNISQDREPRGATGEQIR